MKERPATIDIVISDDHAMFREGLRNLLNAEPGLHVVGEAADGEETISVVRQLNPHILLLDLGLPKLSGLEALRELNKDGVHTLTILLTAAIEREQIVEGLQLGARGVVLKHSALQVLVKCIRCVMQGQYWVGHESVSDVIETLRRMNSSHNPSASNQEFGISSREMQVIALIAAGYTNTDIAQHLQISEHTVKHHVTNILDKLGVSNRLELVLFAIDHGLINGH
jgi:two-component system nitrate/nitrite response regulator NarL